MKLFDEHSGATLPTDGPYDKDTIYAIKMSEVFADEAFNVRGAINPFDVRELAIDIEKNGMQQPITVQPYDRMAGKKFRIIAGHRRHKAHELIKAEYVRAMVAEGMSDMDARVMNLTENVHRAELNILQEAQAIYHLKMGGWTEGEVAEKVGKSRGWAQVRYQLLDLPKEIQEEAALGMISQQQIRELYGLGEASLQYAFMKELKDDKLLGRKKVSKPEKVKVQSKKFVRSAEQIFDTQELIQEAFGVDHPIAIAMGWCAGVIEDRRFHDVITLFAKANGKMYFPPEFTPSENERLAAKAAAKLEEMSDADKVEAEIKAEEKAKRDAALRVGV